MDKKELQDLIRSTVKEEVSSITDPLQKQVTGWSDMFQGGQRSAQDDADLKTDKGLDVARIVRCVAAGKGSMERAMAFAKKAYGKDSAAGERIVAYFERASDAQDFSTGGFMIPEDMSDQIIDLLRPRSVMRAAGTPTVPMPRGTLTLPKQTGDVSANYVGESQDITKSQPTGGQLILSAKKLAALVPISNDLLLYTGGTKADEFVRNSIVRRIATREDRAFLRDDGTQNTPKGLRYWVPSANVIPSSGVTSAQIESDLVKLIQALEGSDVDMSGPAFIMSPRAKNFLFNLRDPNGFLIYPELRLARPTLYTYPVWITNNVPSNLGGGGNETEIYFVNVPDTLIAESGGMEIASDDSASYIEGSTLVSAFSRDQTVIRAIVRHDFAVLHAEATAVMSGVLYGA